MTGTLPSGGDAAFAGVIAAEADPPGVSRERWLDLIASSPRLRALDGENGAALLRDGEVIGQVRWSTTSNELDVYGPPELVADGAWDLAAALDGHFVTLAELTRC